MDSTDGLIAADSQTQAWLSRCTFASPGSHVVCAVSGGADSLAMLVLALAAGLEVTAVHVDHGLRPGSADEAGYVADVTRRWGVELRAASVRIEPGPNLEERARTARYRVLGPDVLTGHTADDQAETVLLQILRGAGVDGIAAMAPGPTKPILALRRTETRGVCQHFGMRWFDDPSNADPRFVRNRVRHEVLPLINDIARRDCVPLLNRTAAAARQSTAVLRSLLPAGDPSDTRWLATLPEDQAVLLVRRWLADRTGRAVSAAATARAMTVVEHRATGTELEGGWSLRRTDGRLRVHAVGDARPASGPPR